MTGMIGPPNRFDEMLKTLRSADLKSIGRVWGVGSTRKEDILADILQRRHEPAQVRAAVGRLNEYERTALALAQWAGGAIESAALMAGLYTLGVEPPKGRQVYNDGARLRMLIDRGLFLGTYGPDSTYIADYGGAVLLPDDQLVHHVGALVYKSLKIEPTVDPATSTYRRPSAVVMDMLALLQAIDQLGGLQLTKAGDVRVNDFRKLNRAMGWKDDGIALDGLLFPAPATALLNALRYSDALRLLGDTLLLADSTDAFARRPYVEQIAGLLRGFLRGRTWREHEERTWLDHDGRNHAAARLALLIALMALPDTPDAFFAIDALDQALFDRIGEHFSLSYPPQKPYFYKKTAQEIEHEEQTWRKQLRAEWLKRERPWLTRALASWAMYFGLVELGIAHDVPISVRLTELGRAILHPDLKIQLDAAPEATGTAWVIQPNFEVLVYLERATPVQIALLEGHAAREHIDQHIARYRLTRETVYNGLERGTALNDLIAELERGAGARLPQNIDFSIREWATQRERITLRKRADLLEFPDGARRQQALDRGLAGRPVGDRFVILDTLSGQLPDHELIDYGRPLPPNLGVSETGIIKQLKPTHDLLTGPQLDRWAERQPDGTWQLTAARVASAIKAGGTMTQVFAFFKERMRQPLPPLLAVALRAWAGKPPQVALATVTVLRCGDPAVFAALAGSPLLAPALRGTLAPDVLLVDTAQLLTIQAQLDWAGVRVVDRLEL